MSAKGRVGRKEREKPTERQKGENNVKTRHGQNKLYISLCMFNKKRTTV
jgi:hypothetical protein